MSEVEIPEDVLELAAQAARHAYLSVPALVDGLLLPRWEAVVKAVASTLDDENTVVLAKCDERDALQARVAELGELAGMWESRAKEVDAHRRALWDITGRDPKVWSEAHARAVLAKGEKP